MVNNNAVISRMVRQHLEATGLTQAALANRIAMSQASMNMKISNRRRWSVDDLARLVDVGALPCDVLLEVSGAGRD